jgi:hypothetical protein
MPLIQVFRIRGTEQWEPGRPDPSGPHTKLESTARDLGIKVENALEMAEQTEA